MSRRAHIAMVGVPAISHVLPSLPILRELVARGHRVTYANDPAMAEVIAATGAEFVRCDSTLPSGDGSWPEDPIAAVELFLDNAIATLPQLHAAYDDDPAEAYLYDIGGYAVRVLAERQQRPLVQLSPTIVGWQGYEEEVAAPMWQLPGAEAFRARFTRWLTESGATTTDMDVFTGRPPRALALIPRAMQPHADRVDTSAVTFVGPCFDPDRDAGGWTRPDGADRVLLVSLGSAFTHQPEFYRQCLAAFGDLPGWHVVLQIGKHTDPAELGDVPGNVEVHSWVPQLAILQQADVFVTQAGMGSSSEGLFAGVPMVAVPQAAEQFLNADRLVELGVARRLDTPQATAQALRQAVDGLLDDGPVADRVAGLRQAVRSEGGTERAADLIEDALVPAGK